MTPVKHCESRALSSQLTRAARSISQHVNPFTERLTSTSSPQIARVCVYFLSGAKKEFDRCGEDFGEIT
jgi:hypothetical protein